MFTHRLRFFHGVHPLLAAQQGYLSIKKWAEWRQWQLILLMLCASLAVAFPASSPASSPAKNPMILAIHEHRDPEHLQAMYQPLATYLSNAMPGREVVLKLFSLSEFKQAMDTNLIDMAIVHPYLYFHLQANRSFVKPIATLQRQRKGHVAHSFGEVIVTLPERNLQSLSSVKGHSIGYYGDPNFATFHLSYYELFKAGVGLHQVERMGFTSNQKLLQALLTGEVDVAIFETGWLENAYQQGRLSADQVKILNAKPWPDFPLSLSTDLYPDSPFILVKPMPQEIQKNISSALFRYQTAGASELFGFIPPVSYLPMESALREMRFAPYDYIPRVSFQEFAYQYRYQLVVGLSLVMILIGLYGHTLRLKRHISHEHQKLNTLITSTHAMLWDWDIETDRVDLNRYWTEFLGYQLEELNPMTKSVWLSMIHPEDRPKVEQCLRQYFTAKQSQQNRQQTAQTDGSNAYYEVSFRLAHKLGGWKWVMARGELTQITKSGQPKRMSGIHIDIDQIKLREEALNHRTEIDQALLQLPHFAEALNEHEFMQKAQEILENLTQSNIAFMHFMHPNQRTIELVAWSQQTLQDYCQLGDYEVHYPLSSAGIWADSARNGKPLIVNDYDSYSDKRGLPVGHAKLNRMISVPVKESGRVVMIVGVGNKPTDYHDLDVDTVQLIANETWRLVKDSRAQHQLEKMANYDQLTGLANRSLLMDRIAQSLRKTLRHPTTIGVMFIDLDGFKYINDHFGHDAGDYLLQVITGRFKQEVRSEDSLGRIGGDEFVLLLESVQDRTMVENIGQRLLQQAAQTVEYHQQSLKVSASIGVVLYRGNGQTNASELISQADKAMYVAKNGGKNRLHLQVFE